jgi:hypothetical protein
LRRPKVSTRKFSAKKKKKKKKKTKKKKKKKKIPVTRSDDSTPKAALASRHRRHAPIFLIKY